MRTVVGMAAIVLLLAGCASERPYDAGTVARTPSEIETSEPAVQTEGSVTTKDGSFVKYPDGLVVRLVKMERLPTEWAADIENGRSTEFDGEAALVRATFNVKNTGTTIIPLADNRLATIYYGENRYEGYQDAGYSDAGSRTLTSVSPARLVAGSSVKMFISYDVPVAELDHLAVEIDLARDDDQTYTPYTFTEAETLIGR